MKYTAEEVRAIAKRLHDDITVADGDALMASDMLNAYADSIERAQAAQVDPAAKPRTLADFVNAHDAERVQIGQQVAARMDEMMAEPVAHGEDVVLAAIAANPDNVADQFDAPVAQGEVVLDADELAEFAKTIAEFNDCEMTETPQHVLMRWAEMGLLVCEQFELTKKGQAMLAAAPSPGES